MAMATAADSSIFPGPRPGVYCLKTNAMLEGNDRTNDWMTPTHKMKHMKVPAAFAHKRSRGGVRG